MVKRAASHIFRAKAIFCRTGQIPCLRIGQSSQLGEVGGTSVLHPRLLDHSFSAFPRPQTMPPLSKTARLWEIFSLAPCLARGSLEVSASTGRGQRRLWERFPLPNTQRTWIQGIFGFRCLFFKPACSLGSAGKRDRGGRERGRVRSILLRLWREAPGPFSREVGPVARLPAGSGEVGSPCTPVSQARECCLPRDLHPQRPGQRCPQRASS